MMAFLRSGLGRALICAVMAGGGLYLLGGSLCLAAETVAAETLIGEITRSISLMDVVRGDPHVMIHKAGSLAPPRIR